MENKNSLVSLVEGRKAEQDWIDRRSLGGNDRWIGAAEGTMGDWARVEK